LCTHGGDFIAFMDQKMQTWLKPNRRALFIIGIAWLMLMGGGMWLVLRTDQQTLWQLVGWMVGAGGAMGVVRTLRALRQPRVAYANAELLLYLRGRNPIRLPIDVVECFFFGQGPSGVRDQPLGSDLESRNVVVRLAERAAEWHHGPVKRGLGHWCDGYITITGTWCEPISPDVVGVMNHELAEVKRQRKAAAKQTALQQSTGQSR
jgi:hypothetical protein